jgi:hypothetical protein
MIRKTENKKQDVVKMEKIGIILSLSGQKAGRGREGKKEKQANLKKTMLSFVVFFSLLTSSMCDSYAH